MSGPFSRTAAREATQRKFLADAPPDHVSVAFAEAIIPGSSGIPAADEQTVLATEALLRELHPGLVVAFRAAQKVLDAAAVGRTGHRFHRLSASEQDLLLRTWDGDPVLRKVLSSVALVYKLVHFDRPERRAGSLDVLRTDRPKWLSQVQRPETWPDGELECDVVVIGSGAGGAVVGRELAERGHAIVFVEEGELYQRDAFDGSSVRAHQRFYRPTFSVGNVVMPIFVGRLVGGSTAINGGTCFRPPPWILERWCEEFKTNEFGTDALRPYFERVEAILNVQPARHETIGPIAGVMARGCDALGWNHFRVRRNAPDCDGSGFCDFGCRREARLGTHIAYVPPALERGALLFVGAKAHRVLLENGRAVGLEARGMNGSSVRIRAKAVVLAGGAIPTPLFLLEQRLAGQSGQLGRNLSVHPSCGFSALFDEPIRPHEHIPQGYGCDEFLADGILMTAAQPARNVAPLLFPFTGRRLMETLDRADHIASFGLLVRDSKPNGRVWRELGGIPAITYDIAAEDVTRMHSAMIRAGEICLAAGAKKLYPVTSKVPVLENRRAFDSFRKAKFGPADFVWLSYHPLGTCKMGLDPRTSVVGLDHQVHDVPGLYVVDGSIVPGPLGVNPQLTIMALATRAATIIDGRL